jgi:hypothetical protein
MDKLSDAPLEAMDAPTQRESYIVTIFTASKDFKNSFIEYIEKEIGITANVYERNNGYAMCFYKKVFILKLYKYFYIDSTMFLDRKKVKFPKS